jgi:hypothetical protein
MFTQG